MIHILSLNTIRGDNLIFFKKKPRETDKITLYKYFCTFKTIDGKEPRYDKDEWCTRDISILTQRTVGDGYIKDNFDNVYPLTNVLSFNWDYWDKREIEYYIDEIDFFIPSFPSEEYIERIRVKGSDINR